MTVQIAAGQSLTLNVTMTIQSGSLEGKVIDAAGPLAGVLVALTGGPTTGLSTTTAANGDYAIAGIAPGTYTVTFSKTGYNTQIK